MTRKAQLRFKGFVQKSFAFGGSLLKNSNAKSKRPISYKSPMHIVLRSTKAKGEQSFLQYKNSKRIRGIIERQARETHIQLLEFANVGNHIHLLIKIRAGNHTQARTQINKLLRSITGLISRHILKVERGCKRLSYGRFWDHRPFTRIVVSFSGYKIASDYVIQNTLEALGIIPYQQRTNSS